MKILMVYCDIPQGNVVPIGITQVITALLNAGHQVELFHTTFYRQAYKSSTELRIEALQFRPCKIRYNSSNMSEDFCAKIQSFRPEIIGFSVVEPSFYIFKKLLNSAKDIIRANRIKIAVGGIHAICWPESIAAMEDIDFISISEAESTFVNLCDRLSSGQDYKDQAGFWIRDGKNWYKNKAASLINLDALPIPEFSIFGKPFLIKPMMGKSRKTVSIELSRGCPYKCTYCADSHLTDKFKYLGKWYRLKSLSKIDEEYAILIKNYQPEFIFKVSESFLAVSKERLKEYYAIYKKYRLPFWIESRPETINEETGKMLAKLNCIRVSVGVESGNEKYRKEYLNRRYSNRQVIEAARILHKYGISFSMNLIIGLPFETRKMIFDGIELLRKAKPNGVTTFFFTPYKGCILRHLCEENNMIEENFIGEDYFQTKYILRNNNFNEKAIIGLWRTVPLYVHLPKSKYPFIRKAENLNLEGDRIFNKLKEEYYKKMRWDK